MMRAALTDVVGGLLANCPDHALDGVGEFGSPVRIGQWVARHAVRTIAGSGQRCFGDDLTRVGVDRERARHRSSSMPITPPGRGTCRSRRTCRCRRTRRAHGRTRTVVVRPVAGGLLGLGGERSQLVRDVWITAAPSSATSAVSSGASVAAGASVARRLRLRGPGANRLSAAGLARPRHRAGVLSALPGEAGCSVAPPMLEERIAVRRGVGWRLDRGGALSSSLSPSNRATTHRARRRRRGRPRQLSQRVDVRRRRSNVRTCDGLPASASAGSGLGQAAVGGVPGARGLLRSRSRVRRRQGVRTTWRRAA